MALRTVVKRAGLRMLLLCVQSRWHERGMEAQIE